MAIANTDNTLAKEFGVSGTLSARKGLHPITPLTMTWRRVFEPADALLSAVTTQAGVALAERTVNVVEGQWVTLDTDGKAVIAADAEVGPAYPVFSGGDRLDPKGGVAVLHGAIIFDTSFFDDGGTYAVGTLLQIGTATVQTVAAQAGALTDLTLSAVGDVPKAKATIERTPIGTSSETPTGVMRVKMLLTS